MSRRGQGRGLTDLDLGLTDLDLGLTGLDRPRPSASGLPAISILYSVDRELILEGTTGTCPCAGMCPPTKARGLPLVGCLDL